MKIKVVLLALALASVLYMQFCVDFKSLLSDPSHIEEEGSLESEAP